ncbi:hypothetical protein [Bacillus sp. USDA818B3_A]|nr:hypothetical protein [Bacillus sp. USDA818B3_A]
MKKRNILFFSLIMLLIFVSGFLNNGQTSGSNEKVELTISAASGFKGLE